MPYLYFYVLSTCFCKWVFARVCVCVCVCVCVIVYAPFQIKVEPRVHWTYNCKILGIKNNVWMVFFHRAMNITGSRNTSGRYSSLCQRPELCGKRFQLLRLVYTSCLCMRLPHCIALFITYLGLLKYMEKSHYFENAM